jgi:alpha-amylase/alpha-mannosidase (GH57 family)
MEKGRNHQKGRRKLYWANLLHFYQPPDQDRAILERVVNESYHPVLRIFEQIPSAKASVNIQACLIELLIKTGFGKIVSRIRALAEQGQIELTMTPRFHPFLPFTPEDEADRQIAQHAKICTKYFGLNFNPRGFFSPEMAYSTNIGKFAARYGCRWQPVDEITIDGTLDQLPYDRLYMDKGAGGLVLVPRHRRLSEALGNSLFSKDSIKNTNDFIKMIEDGRRKYIFTANDVENFGHHQKSGATLLRLLYRDSRLTSVTISELLNHVRKKEYCRAPQSDWTSTVEEVKKKQVHRTWKDPSNKIHQTLWDLYKLAYTEIKNAGQSGDILHTRARDMLAAAVPSCSFFWASCRPWWYGVYPENAATGMCLALYSLLNPPAKIKDKAFKMRQQIYDMVRQYNEQGEAKKQQIRFLKSRGIDPKRFFGK